MKTNLLFKGYAIIAFALISIPFTASSQPQQVAVCHNGNTIYVNQNAVQSHLNHGDILGPCPSITQKKVPVCHNGNTIYVNPNAVMGHLQHGDTQGPCDFCDRGIPDRDENHFPYEVCIDLGPPIQSQVPVDRFNEPFSTAFPFSGNPNDRTIGVVTCASGFVLFFEDCMIGNGIGFDDNSPSPCGNPWTLGQDRINLACEVMDYVASIVDLNTAQPEIWFTISENITPAVGALGTASAFYDGVPTPNTFEGGYVFERIISGGIDPDLNPATPDAEVFIDFGTHIVSGVPIPVNSCNTCVTGEIDLYSLLLHEITHALGFVSFIDQNGLSTRSGLINGPFSTYDQFLFDDIGTPANLVSGTAVFVASVLDLTNDMCIYDEISNSGPQPLYCPSPFDFGSSLSHFNDVTSGLNYVMRPATSGEPSRYYHQSEVEVLGNLGYNILTPNAGIVYPTGLPDAGTTTVGTLVCVDVLGNDNMPNGPINIAGGCGVDGCTGLPIAPGIVIITGGGTAVPSGTDICYTPDPSFIGTAHLQYCIEDAFTTSGGFQNPYDPIDVFIEVTGTYCPDDPCNLVCNGDFEGGIGPCGCLTWTSVGTTTSPINNWFKSTTGTPDYLIDGNSGCNPGGCVDYLDVSQNYFGNPPTNGPPPDERYVGLIGNPTTVEGIYTELLTPLVPGNSYTLTISTWGSILPSNPNFLNVFLLDRLPFVPQFGQTPLVGNDIAIFSNEPVTKGIWTNHTISFVAPPTTGTQTLVIEPSIGPTTRMVIDDVRLESDAPPLDVTKTILPSSNLVPGGQVDYEIEICNPNVTPATGVEVTDFLSPDLVFLSSTSGSTIFTGLTVPGSGCVSVFLSATIPLTAPLNAPIGNCADVTDGGTSCASILPGTNCVEFEIDATDILVNKTVDQSSIAGSGTATATFTVTVTNLGPKDATTIIVNDLISAIPGISYASHTITPTTGNTYVPGTGNLNITSLLVGNTVTLEIVVTGDLNATNNCVDVENCATLVSLDQAELNFTNNSDCADLIVLTESCDVAVVPSPCFTAGIPCYTDLVIKTGSNVTWTTTGVTGSGPSALPHPGGCLPTNILIQNNLVIEPGAILTIDPGVTVAFSPVGKVTVEYCGNLSSNGGLLVLNGSTLTSQPACMWQGVKVKGDELLDQSTPANFNIHGRLQMTNGALIENAYTGVELNCPGGIIEADNSTFLNNNVAVNFAAYDFPSASVLDNNIFECNGPINDPQFGTTFDRSQSFVVMQGIDDVSFLGTNQFFNSGITSAGYPTFGIISANSSYDVNNQYFSKLASCIWSTNTLASFNTHNIINNTFLFTRAEVFLESSLLSTVQNNVSNSTISALGVAVHCRSSEGFTVRDNAWENVEFGMFSVNSGSTFGSQVYKNNHFNATRTGMVIQGDNSMLDIRCNLWNNFSHGCWNLSDFPTGSGNLLLPDQGACPGDPAGNEFYPISPTGSIFVTNTTAPLPAFEYFYETGSGPQYIPAIIFPPGSVTSTACGTSNPTVPFCSALFSPGGGGTNSMVLNNSDLDELSAKMSSSEDKMEKAAIRTTLARHLIATDDLEGLETLLREAKTKNSRKLLLAFHIKNGKISDAREILEQLPRNTHEERTYYNYHSLMCDLLEDGKSVYDITAEQVDIVRRIAQTKTNTAGKAKSLLWLLFGEPYIVDCELMNLCDEYYTTQENDLLNDGSLSIFPNPNGGSFNVFVEHIGESNTAKMTIFNSLGQEVAANSILLNQQFHVDLSGTAKGLYFIKVETNGKTWMEKVIYR